MMTLQDAYDAIKARWTCSWSIDVTVWHYDHRPADPPEVGYRIWNGARATSYRGPTLEMAVRMALADETGPPSLAVVQREIEGSVV